MHCDGSIDQVSILRERTCLCTFDDLATQFLVECQMLYNETEMSFSTLLRALPYELFAW